jgi:uncharacterized protein with PIN domain
LGRGLAQALRDSGFEAHYHDEHFPQNTPDAEWLLAVAARGWIVLTRDDRIRYRPAERQVLENAGVIAIILTATRINGREAIRIFQTQMPKILAFISTAKKPGVALLNRSGLTRKI